MLDGIAKYKLRIEFTEAILGSTPLNAEVYTDFVASRAAKTKATNLNGNVAEEVLTVQDLDIKGRTGFHRDEAGKPYIYNYVVKGFMKETWRALRQQRNRLSAKLTAGASKIDMQLFVFPRLIPLIVSNPSASGILERPLRAQTPQGPRVALAASEMLPERTVLTCELHVLLPDVLTQELLTEWVEYGQYSGIGQWRSGGYGTFAAKLTRI